jgi:acyl-coenzyme A synthetase/AMP-(fatty) acid ligase
VTAAVVLSPNSELTSEEISKMVEDKLEDCKRLRGGVFFVDRLPRNPQGKIQRRKLPEMVRSL